MEQREIKLTAKRQATFPAALCREMGVQPGDRLVLERREIDGEASWVLRRPAPDWEWAGSLKEYGSGRSHEWEAIEASIERGRGRESDA
jgi:bifunctional DNA-binding transcriptional regulator/antitoxin component of YhaV-PrlF toxin-antitoxin module